MRCARIDSAICPIINLKRGEELDEKRYGLISGESAQFVESSAYTIVQSVLGNGARTKEVVEKIKGLESITGAELLLTLEETNDSRLLDDPFLSRLGKRDMTLDWALLYEIRITGNVAALTDPSIFAPHATDFFTRIGPEAASEWFNSIGKTRDVAGLTSREVLRPAVAAAINQSGKIASELSYCIGTMGSAGLIDSDFLQALSGPDPARAGRLLSEIWVTRQASLATAENVARIMNSGNDILMATGRGSAFGPVLMINTSEVEHDRSVLLHVQGLMDSGISVIYAGNIRTPGEVLDLAKSFGARAIGFSVMEGVNQQLILDTVSYVRSGLPDVAMFGGGFVSQHTTSAMQLMGVKVFEQGASVNDIKGFLNTPLTVHFDGQVRARNSNPSKNHHPLTSAVGWRNGITASVHPTLGANQPVNTFTTTQAYARWKRTRKRFEDEEDDKEEIERTHIDAPSDGVEDSKTAEHTRKKKSTHTKVVFANARHAPSIQRRSVHGRTAHKPMTVRDVKGSVAAPAISQVHGVKNMRASAVDMLPAQTAARSADKNANMAGVSSTPSSISVHATQIMTPAGLVLHYSMPTVSRQLIVPKAMIAQNLVQNMALQPKLLSFLGTQNAIEPKSTPATVSARLRLSASRKFRRTSLLGGIRRPSFSRVSA